MNLSKESNRTNFIADYINVSESIDNFISQIGCTWAKGEFNYKRTQDAFGELNERVICFSTKVQSNERYPVISEILSSKINFARGVMAVAAGDQSEAQMCFASAITFSDKNNFLGDLPEMNKPFRQWVADVLSYYVDTDLAFQIRYNYSQGETLVVPTAPGTTETLADLVNADPWQNQDYQDSPTTEQLRERASLAEEKFKNSAQNLLRAISRSLELDNSDLTKIICEIKEGLNECIPRLAIGIDYLPKTSRLYQVQGMMLNSLVLTVERGESSVDGAQIANCQSVASEIELDQEFQSWIESLQSDYPKVYNLINPSSEIAD